ncbi:MAG: cytochrome c peroxidase [Pseudohongiellaceae bacterium]
MGISWLILSGPQALSQDDSQRQTRLEDLGRMLFFDVNLSRDRTQSCATCHDPAQAFIDWRDNGVNGAASLGGDGMSLGDRNSPTLTYASMTPEFHRINEGEDQGEYAGGMFLDGRENDLEGQAGQPFLNPIEMAMPDPAGVISRIQENPVYNRPFTNLFGEDVFADTDKAYRALSSALAAFERTEFFSPFDSKYDRYLRGEYSPTREEELGLTLFFSEQFTNCNQCHQLNARPNTGRETFSNYVYENIGVPVNTRLRSANGLGPDYVDHGLLGNPAIDDPAQDGKFKATTLRNVAITGPYMHNGVFQELRTVVLFYNKYNARSSQSQINPETGQSWGEPEVSANLALEELESAPALDDERIDALVAFMKMLTDRRYEHLLE